MGSFVSRKNGIGSCSWGAERKKGVSVNNNGSPNYGLIAQWTVAVIVLLGVSYVIAGAIWGFGVATAPIFGRGEAEKRIQSADSRLVNYNHFFDLCVSVQNNESSLDAQIDVLQDAETSADRSRIKTNIAGLKAARMSGINEYNADARKDYTMGQFRDADLPYQLPVTEYNDKGEHTSCDA